MVRLIFWFLGFEFWNIIAILIYIKPFQFIRKYISNNYYFAFGANLDSEILNKRRIKVLQEENYILKDWKLVFDLPGVYENLGFASVQPSTGDFIFGKIYKINFIDVKRLDYFEGYTILRIYNKLIKSQDGKKFFFYKTACPRNNLVPSKSYLKRIISAAENFEGLPQTYIDQLKQIET